MGERWNKHKKFSYFDTLFRRVRTRSCASTTHPLKAAPTTHHFRCTLTVSIRRKFPICFFCGKERQGLPPCIDYHGLNAMTIKYPYLLPLVPAALEQLRKATIFTKLDLRSAYHLIRIREGDEWKTAFSTISGHHIYRVMPYRLSSAASVFQCFINTGLHYFLGIFVIASIDDILIYSRDHKSHIQHVNKVLAKLEANNLYVKKEKCVFHVPETSCLGYIIDRNGVTMDQVKG